MKRAALTLSLLTLPCCSAAFGATGPPTVGITASQSGAGLYAANCSTCHGPHGQGIAPPGRRGVGDLLGEGPSLLGVGAGTVDLYLRLGFMPLANPHIEPWQSTPLFSNGQIKQLVQYVSSFRPGPPIPAPDPARGSLSAGFVLFTDHCAGCHQVAAEGGYVTGARVPALSDVTDVEIAEAVRAGPYVMPKFTVSAISGRQLDSIIRYLDYAKHPADPGGWSIGRIGPVPEGMITWFVAIAVLVGLCLVLGRRGHHG